MHIYDQALFVYIKRWQWRRLVVSKLIKHLPGVGGLRRRYRLGLRW